MEPTPTTGKPSPLSILGFDLPISPLAFARLIADREKGLAFIRRAYDILQTTPEGRDLVRELEAYLSTFN